MFVIENFEEGSPVARIEHNPRTRQIRFFDANGKLIKEQTLGPREYGWGVPDPKAEQYYSTSPYAYCLNNPIKHIDPDGRSTWVRINGDGMYEVFGGNLNDKDLNIYVYTQDKNGDYSVRGGSIGITTSMTSFYYGQDGVDWLGTINMNDNSGKEFIGGLVGDNPALGDYMANGTAGQKYDFKRQGMTGGDDPNYFYRGMPVGQTKDGVNVITSARDIGNIGAGYVAGLNGVPWGVARTAFDILEHQQNQGTIESMSSQNAQRYGHQMGATIAGVEPLIVRQWRLMRNAVSIPRAIGAYVR